MMSVKKKSGLDNPAFVAIDSGAGKEEHGDQIVNNNNNNASGLVISATTTTPSSNNIEQDIDHHHQQQWGNSIEFLMSCIAMSVGLGNIWRFPFTAYQNGGGAFLIPYIIILTLIGRPLYYMEMALGQFSARGNAQFYMSLSPWLKGVGYGQVIGSICVATYYCCLMAITLFYLVNSFTANLPWSQCLDEWTDYLNRTNLTCVAASTKGSNLTNGNAITNNTNTVSSSELWFTREVLKERTDISEGIGMPEWRLTLCLFVSWLITYLVSIKGVQSSGKASYFLAIFPYVIIVTILVRAATLEGAAEGMYYFIKTDWSKLIEPDVWYAAVTQCFFSLNVGFGTIIMYSTHNDFNHNINRDALIVTTLDTFTSLLSGVTIFGILGNLAHELDVTPDQVINSGGVGLAFISYPDAIAKFEAVPWLFAILFFFMLFVLGIGSLVALHGTANTLLAELFPKVAVWKTSAVTAAIGFLIGLIYVTPGGQFMLNLMDYFGGTFVIFIFVLIEVGGVCWYYGLDDFCLDIEYMLNRKVGIYWRITWGLITPVLLFAIFVYFLVKLERLTYDGREYPDEILAVGWTILGFSVLQFLLCILYYVWSNREFGYPKMVRRTFAHDDWGPKGDVRREEWRKFKENAVCERDKRRDGLSWCRNKIAILLGR